MASSYDVITYIGSATNDLAGNEGFGGVLTAGRVELAGAGLAEFVITNTSARNNAGTTLNELIGVVRIGSGVMLTSGAAYAIDASLTTDGTGRWIAIAGAQGSIVVADQAAGAAGEQLLGTILGSSQPAAGVPVAGGVVPDGAAAAGVAATFARSDHVHTATCAITAALACVPDSAAAEGAAAFFARSDHVHTCTCAAPAAGIGAALAEGVAATFARSDHDHTILETGAQELTAGAIGAGETLCRQVNAIEGVMLTAAQVDTMAELTVTGATVPGIPVMFQAVLPNQAADTDITLNVGTNGAVGNYKVVHFRAVKITAAGGGAGATVQLTTVAPAAITDALVLNVADQAVVDVGTIDDGTHVIAAAGVLRITQVQGGQDSACEVYVTLLPMV